MIDYNGGWKGPKARYAVPWRRCFYCSTELRFYFKTARICDECDISRFTTQRRAASIVRTAVCNGSLPRPDSLPCSDCQKPAVQYDHRDYSKPLDVKPVCSSCNQKRGQAQWLGHQAKS